MTTTFCVCPPCVPKSIHSLQPLIPWVLPPEPAVEVARGLERAEEEDGDDGVLQQLLLVHVLLVAHQTEQGLDAVGFPDLGVD